MYLVLVTALLAVCGADKLDRTYLPPASAFSAGGSPGSLQTPFRTFNQGLGGLPKGGYSNDFEGVVVDVAAPGTRASGADETGLGGPRIAYGSTDSKVGDAAFTADAAFPRVGANSGPNTPGSFGAQKQVESRPERVQSSRDRISNIVKYQSDVGADSFNYAFETDNGIIAEEVGIEVNGVRAQGGYSYTGDDGQVYSVTYTADEEGYRPKGDHLPTPPPIPVEILKSLEKNAQDEAAGVVDDGSYDAQKYNTGEDYTKTDSIAQYNSDQRAPLGNRPQSDPVASGSFISQNNQGFVRPNSNQFGSNPSFDSSNNNFPLNVNNVVGNNGKRPTNNAQIGFGIVTNNEYLPPKNIFSQNLKPGINNRPFGIQNNPQNGFQSALNVDSGVDKNLNSEIPSFVPLAQQKLQEDKPKRPQANFPIFGKPTLIDSTLSIKDPFARVPTGNKFTQTSQTKQPNQKLQAIGGSYEVVSGNVYSSKNEYLPPRRQNNRPGQNFQGITGTQSNQQFPFSQFLKPNLPSATAFASVSRPNSGYQQLQQYSGQAPQYTGNGFSNQASQTLNSRPQASLSSGFPSTSTINRSPVSQPQYKPSTFGPQSPTLQPQTELTTPFESNSNRNKSPLPIPVIDGPDAPSPTGSSNLPSFGSKPTNDILGQYSFNPDQIQQASPTSSSTLSDQFFTTNFQNEAKPETPEHSQIPNKVPGNSQYSFSTQRPTIGQYSQLQGSDDSYYYNTPSKPFNTPTPRPQNSLFPSTAFDQTFDVNKTPFGAIPQLSDTPETFFTPQSNTPVDSTRYPKPTTLEPISPTIPTKEYEKNSNTINTQYNKLTQATTSYFFSPKPTVPADSERNQFGQFGLKPFQQNNQFNKDTQGSNQPASPFAQATASVQPVTPGPASYKPSIENANPTTNKDSSSQSQTNFGGEVYEYKKPPQTLPTPSNSVSGQFGQTPQFGLPVTTSQFVQSQTPGAFTPSSSQFSQQPSTFGQRPQSPQVSQKNPPYNFNNQAQTQFQPGQFSSQPSNPSQNTQKVQGASKFPPAYNKEVPACCKQIGVAPQSSQADEQDKTTQFGAQYRPTQDFSQQDIGQGSKPSETLSSFASIGENFGGPRKPPSFDQTGYHY